MRLTALRHGETTANRDKITQGQLDTDLTAKGLEQAKTTALLLADRKFDVVVSSDLKRCRLTAEQCMMGRGAVQLIVTPQIREYSFGIHQGEHRDSWSWPDMVAPSDVLRKAPGGESALEVSQRLAACVNELYAQYPDGDVLMVTHGGPIGLLRVMTGEIVFEERRTQPIDNCSAWEFTIDQPIEALQAQRVEAS